MIQRQVKVLLLAESSLSHHLNAFLVVHDLTTAIRRSTWTVVVALLVVEE